MNDRPSASILKVIILVLLLLAVVVTVVLVIAVNSPPTSIVPPTEATTALRSHGLLHILLALVAIVATARVAGAAVRLVGQPAVMGELLGGILLGPTVLGRIVPDTAAYLFPTTLTPTLGIIAQLGVVLFMFLVGLELDLRLLRRGGATTLAVSMSSVAVPFVLGASTAFLLFDRFAPNGVSFAAFALFMGVSLAVTAFPVLARILKEFGMHGTRIGALALTSAAINDLTAWCLLALVVGVATAQPETALSTAVLTLGFVVLLLFVARPLVNRYWPRLEASSRLSRETAMAVAIGAALLSAFVTEWIGIHAIFGAFLIGVAMSAGGRIGQEVTGRLEDVVRVLLLPVFFAYTGLRTQFGLLDTATDWATCLGIIVVATAGKLGGTFVAAKFMGLGTRQSAMLGVLMNTRGLVELIVLNVGLDLGIISPRLFAMLVIMALVTTFATTPLMRLLMRGQQPMVAGR